MRARVCVCVCACVYLFECVRVCASLCTGKIFDLNKSLCMCVCICLCVCINLCLCVYACPEYSYLGQKFSALSVYIALIFITDWKLIYSLC